VGQLVAETLKLYGRHVWLALALGLAPATIDLVATELSRTQALVFVPLAGGLVLTAAFVAA
jgi:heme exporter protein D